MNFYDVLLSKKLNSKTSLNMPLYEQLLAKKLQGGDPYVLKTASGALIHITDAVELPMESAVAGIAYVQDLHGYAKPWLGGNGKNILNATYIFGGQTDTYEVAGGVTVTVKKNDARGWDSLRTISLEAGTYTLSRSNTNGKMIARSSVGGTNKFHEAADGVAKVTFTLASAGVIVMKIGIDSSTYPFTTTVQLERGSSETTFEPYENICPIVGFTEATIFKTGKNFFDKTGADTAKGYIANNYLSTTNAAIPSSNFNISEYIAIKPNTAYVLSGTTGSSPSYGFYDVNKRFISGTAYGGATSKIFTTPSNARYIRFSIPKANIDVVQLEVGTSATAYEAYNGTTYSVSWQTEAGTVYDGHVDLVSGELTVTWGGIASYNGETLPSTWVSDRDVYAEGTTPTIGAQIVYQLAEPITYQLTPQEVVALAGNCYVWSDTGDTTIQYYGLKEMFTDESTGTQYIDVGNPINQGDEEEVEQ